MKPKYTDRTRYPHGYVRSHDTDVKATFRRIQREQVAQAERDAAIAKEKAEKVETLQVRKPKHG